LHIIRATILTELITSSEFGGMRKRPDYKRPRKKVVSD
jgi:hypothetical protein